MQNAYDKMYGVANINCYVALLRSAASGMLKKFGVCYTVIRVCTIVVIMGIMA